jgi:hypothetical protein
VPVVEGTRFFCELPELLCLLAVGLRRAAMSFNGLATFFGVLSNVLGVFAPGLGPLALLLGFNRVVRRVLPSLSRCSLYGKGTISSRRVVIRRSVQPGAHIPNNGMSVWPC